MSVLQRVCRSSAPRSAAKGLLPGSGLQATSSGVAMLSPGSGPEREQLDAQSLRRGLHVSRVTSIHSILSGPYHRMMETAVLSNQSALARRRQTISGP